MGALSKIAISSDGSWSKWQIALVITVPVAFGLGYLYYKNKENSKPSVVNKSKTDQVCNNVGNKSVKKTVAEKCLSPVQKAELVKNQGNEFFKTGNYTEAIRCYTEAIQICPENEKYTLATFYQNRAAAYDRLDNVEAVISDCTSALELNKRYLKAIVRRAKACEKAKKLELALEDIAVANIIENCQNQEIVEEMDRVSQKSGRECSQTFLNTHVAKLPSKFFVKTYLSTFKHGSAFDKLDNGTSEKLLEKFKQAENYLLSGQSAEIENTCSELIKESEELGNELMKAETLLLRGTYYTLSKQNSNAVQDLTTIIENYDIDNRVKINALIKRATVYQHLGEPEKCYEDFYKAEQIDESNPDIHHHLGQIYLILDRLPDSVNSFRKACALDPESPISAIQHCFAEYKYAAMQGDKETEEHFFKEFKNIMNKYPESIECKTLYAQVLVEKREYAEAEILFNSAIEKEPYHAALYVHKALLILQWTADINVAKSLIKEAIKLDKDCEFAYETIATIEMQLGNFKAAVDYFNEAILRYTSVDDLIHLYCVRNTAEAQIKASERLGLFAGTPAADLK